MFLQSWLSRERNIARRLAIYHSIEQFELYNVYSGHFSSRDYSFEVIGFKSFLEISQKYRLISSWLYIMVHRATYLSIEQVTLFQTLFTVQRKTIPFRSCTTMKNDEFWGLSLALLLHIPTTKSQNGSLLSHAKHIRTVSILVCVRRAALLLFR
jgi:hypothetical protein